MQESGGGKGQVTGRSESEISQWINRVRCREAGRVRLQGDWGRVPSYRQLSNSKVKDKPMPEARVYGLSQAGLGAQTGRQAGWLLRHFPFMF